MTKEEQEKTKRKEIFLKSQAYAKENLEKAIKIKNKYKDERSEEIRKFSPINSKETIIASSCDNRKIGNALSLEEISNTQVGFGVPKSKQITPMYNDFLNDIFAQKQHQAYKLREKNDVKVNFISSKYGSAFNKDDPEAEKKINDELEKRTNEKFR